MKFPGRLGYRPVTHTIGLLTLLAIYHLGGKANTARALDYLGRILKPAFEDEDMVPEIRNGVRVNAQRWHHDIHARLSNPVNGLRYTGYVLPVSESARGVWALSDKGRHRIQTLLKAGHDPESHITLNELSESLDLPFLKGETSPPPMPEQLDIAPSRRGRPPRQSVPEYNSESRQSQILAEEIARIREFLNGNGALRPDDQTLCDWVWFCYKFEMYAEGTTLFPLIHSESVDRWLYERTKKLAEICALRKE